MLFAAFLSLLLLLGVGESPYLLPNMASYVKKYVEDKDREKELLYHVKDAKNEKKSFNKTEHTITKKLNRLLKLQSTTQEEFDIVTAEYYEARSNYERKSNKIILESQAYIIEPEWEKIKLKIREDLGKTSDQTEKRKARLRKDFAKDEAKLKKVIEDTVRLNKALAGIDEFEEVLIKVMEEYQYTLTDESSLFYQYKVDSVTLNNASLDVISKSKHLIDAYIDYHFIIANSTSSKEWKKLNDVGKVTF